MKTSEKCIDCGEFVWWDRENNLVTTSDGDRWCFGPARSRIAMTHHHATPGMSQYVVRAREGEVCHCLDRSKPHIHQIVLVEED